MEECFNDLVVTHQGKATINTMIIAKLWGKNKKDILKKNNQLNKIIDKEIAKKQNKSFLNDFEIHVKGTQTMYVMDEQGFQIIKKYIKDKKAIQNIQDAFQKANKYLKENL